MVTQQSGTQQSGTHQPDATAVDAGKIVDLVRSKMTSLDLSGAVFGVWQGDENVVSDAVGGSPIGVPATPDRQLRVGQPMEPMLSTVLIQLDEDETLSPDEPIAKWVPDFSRADLITPRMLAGSTSGISDYVTNPALLQSFYANPIREFAAQEILDLATARPPLFDRGTSWSYSHSDLCLLGAVLEKATGRELGDLLQERVFGPLGMSESFYGADSTDCGADGGRVHQRARGVEDSTFWNPTAFLNSGNMNSTVTDVARWVRALGNGDCCPPTVSRR